MSGPYNHQVAAGQSFGQGIGYTSGVNASQFGGNAAGQAVGQIAGQAAGLAAAAQAAGQNFTQTSSTYRAESHQTQQNPGVRAQQLQRNERETSSQAASIQHTAESHQTQQSSNSRGEKLQRNERETSSQPASTQRSAEVRSSRHASKNQGGHHHHRHRERTNSQSSSSSSEGVYKLAGGDAGAAGLTASNSHQQYSAESAYAYGGAANGVVGAYGGAAYGATGAYGGAAYGATGAYGAGAAPCGTTQVEGPRRPGRHQKQVIRLPDQAQGATRQVRRRLPTPEPDTLERVYIQRVGGEVIEEITEIPTTPPPRVQERTVTEPAGPPRVVKRTIRVPPRGGDCQQSGGFSGNVGQSNNLLSAGSYGSVQQASGNFQQQGAASPSINSGASFGTGFGNAVGGASQGAGFGGAVGNFSPAGGSYSSVNQAYGTQNAGFPQQAPSFGGGFQQQAASFGGGFQQQAASFGGGFQQQAASFGSGFQQRPTGAFSFIAQGLTPSAGLHQATCFYV
ncbi:hypothetical protein I4U23_024642 [Adineta vaga]|nr:hypothetical protein I4U23_024642 [Adineta vaga]